jgi:hypothetical protein
MSETLEEPALAQRPAEIRGLVDNATDTKLYGWAWNAANPGERLAIELRVRDEPVATCLAELERKDLAKAGIGDGRHAFELPLKPAWARRHADLTIIARAADGTELPLALQVRRADIDPTGALQRTLEATATAHRQLREDLQALAARLPTTDLERDEAVRALAASQAALEAKLETLTHWLTRLDEKLAALPVALAAPPRRGLDGWQAVLAVMLALALSGAAWFTFGHLLPR